MLLTWRYHQVARRPVPVVPDERAEPARPPQTPIARFTQTSTTSIPTFS